MDQTTQQNAALVEEMAAAASSLKGQAQELVQAVAFFKLGASTSPAPSMPRTAVRAPASQAKPFKGEERRAIAGKPAAPKPAARPVANPATETVAKPAVAAAPKTQSKPAPAGGDDDWETF